jgi:hypothetical protein
VQRGIDPVKRSTKARKQNVPLEGQWKLPLGAAEHHHRTRAEYRRCGAGRCGTCRDGPGHGPYLYAVWREGGKVKRRYLGRA